MGLYAIARLHNIPSRPRIMTANLRWQLKKVARKGMALGACATGYILASSMRIGNPQVRVLTYHRFGTVARDPFCVAPSDFEAQMAYLADRKLVISLVQFEDFVAGKGSLPHGSVLITVDDGFRSLYATALPILRHYDLPAVAFISPSLIGSRGTTIQGQRAESPEDHLDWDELAALADSKIVIGSHAWTHRSMGRLPSSEVTEEVTRSREMLEQKLGKRVGSFAYPFGTRADFNQTTADILPRCGYSCAFTSQHGPVCSGMEPFSLPRIKVEGGEGLWLFRLLVQGGLDGWRWVDKSLWRIQASGHG